MVPARSPIYDLTLTRIDGASVSMQAYHDEVLLIVNVASRCGYTSQYAGLEALYRRHRDRGFAVLGFPCDQFGHQEPGAEAEIDAFCISTYGVTFPMFSKVRVNGDDAHPLFVFLKAQKKGLFGFGSIKWNFTKFLVGRQGQVLRRFAPAASPASLEPALVQALAVTR